MHNVERIARDDGDTAPTGKDATLKAPVSRAPRSRHAHRSSVWFIVEVVFTVAAIATLGLSVSQLWHPVWIVVAIFAAASSIAGTYVCVHLWRA